VKVKPHFSEERWGFCFLADGYVSRMVWKLICHNDTCAFGTASFVPLKAWNHLLGSFIGVGLSMNHDRQDFMTLLGIVIAGVVTVASQSGPFTLWETMIGFILFDLLLCIDSTGFRTIREKIAFGATAGFCLTITAGFFIQMGLDKLEYFRIPHGQEESARKHVVFFCLWVVLSLIAYPTIHRLNRRFKRRP
jgi:hypothetical protein